jgi:hypothetical protein
MTILFRIVGRISKKSWKQAPLNTISTQDNDAEDVCIDEVIIEK